MNIFKFLWALWVKDGTKVLGYFQGTILGLIAIDGLISPAHIKYWAAAGVILSGAVVRRGYVNSAESKP